MNLAKLTLPAASLAVLLSIGLSAGCASRRTDKVTIDALTRAKGATGKSYWIKTKGGQGDDSLRQKEMLELVRTALAGRGMYEEPAMGKPDTIIELEWGVSTDPAVKTDMVKVPVYARRGGTMTYDQIEVKDELGNVTTRTVPVIDPPHAETIGFEERITSVPIFEKFMRISARENVPAPEGRTTAEIWSVNASVDSPGKDVRQYLPALAAAAMDAVADDTGHMKTVNIKSNAPDVGFVKKGL